MFEQLLEHLDVHPFDLAGEQVIHAVQNAEWVGDDGIGARGAQVNRRKALEDLVRQPIWSHPLSARRRSMPWCSTATTSPCRCTRSSRKRRRSPTPSTASAGSAGGSSLPGCSTSSAGTSRSGSC